MPRGLPIFMNQIQGIEMQSKDTIFLFCFTYIILFLKSNGLQCEAYFGLVGLVIFFQIFQIYIMILYIYTTLCTPIDNLLWFGFIHQCVFFNEPIFKKSYLPSILALRFIICKKWVKCFFSQKNCLPKLKKNWTY